MRYQHDGTRSARWVPHPSRSLRRVGRKTAGLTREKLLFSAPRRLFLYFFILFRHLHAQAGMAIGAGLFQHFKRRANSFEVAAPGPVLQLLVSVIEQRDLILEEIQIRRGVGPPPATPRHA